MDKNIKIVVIEVTEGAVYVKRKDKGVHLIIKDYDTQEENPFISTHIDDEEINDYKLVKSSK